MGSQSPAESSTAQTVDTSGQQPEQDALDQIFGGLDLLDENSVPASQDLGSTPDATTDTPPESSGSDTVPPAADQSALPKDQPSGDTETDADWDPKLPFHTHPRWKETQEAKNRYKRELEEARQENERIRAELGGATPQELAQARLLLRSLQSPDERTAKEALSVFAPIVQRLSPLAGGQVQLPPELAEQVEAGILPVEAAEQQVRLQAQLDAAEARNRAAAEQIYRAQAERAAQEVRSATAAVVDTWKSDPAFDAKRAAVFERLGTLAPRLNVRTPDDVHMVLRMIKAEVDQLPEFATPAKPATVQRKPVDTLSDSGIVAHKQSQKSSQDPMDRVFAGLPLRFLD